MQQRLWEVVLNSPNIVDGLVSAVEMSEEGRLDSQFISQLDLEGYYNATGKVMKVTILPRERPFRFSGHVVRPSRTSSKNVLFDLYSLYCARVDIKNEFFDYMDTLTEDELITFIGRKALKSSYISALSIFTEYFIEALIDKRLTLYFLEYFLSTLKRGPINDQMLKERCVILTDLAVTKVFSTDDVLAIAEDLYDDQETNLVMRTVFGLNADLLPDRLVAILLYCMYELSVDDVYDAVNHYYSKGMSCEDMLSSYLPFYHWGRSYGVRVGTQAEATRVIGGVIVSECDKSLSEYNLAGNVFELFKEDRPRENV